MPGLWPRAATSGTDFGARTKGVAGELEAFFESLRTGAPMPVSLASLALTTLTTFAIEASLRAATPVAMTEVIAGPDGMPLRQWPPGELKLRLANRIRSQGATAGNERWGAVGWWLEPQLLPEAPLRFRAQAGRRLSDSAALPRCRAYLRPRIGRRDKKGLRPAIRSRPERGSNPGTAGPAAVTVLA